MTTTVEGFKKGRVPREVRVRQLLDHAEELLLRDGYDGFSIEDLCRAAGVSRPVVYEHFGSKEGVYLACQRRVRDEFDEALRVALTGTELEPIIRQTASVYFGMLEENPRRWLFVFGSTSGFTGPMAEQLYDMRLQTILGIAALTAALRPDMSQEQATAVAHMVSGAGEELGRWWMRHQEVPRERIIEYYVAGMRLLAADLPAL